MLHTECLSSRTSRAHLNIGLHRGCLHSTFSSLQKESKLMFPNNNTRILLLPLQIHLLSLDKRFTYFAQTVEAAEEQWVRNWWNCECEKRLVEVRLLVKKVELKDLSPESQRRFVACNSAAYLANSKTNVYSRQHRRKTLCTLLLFLQSSHTQPPRIVKYTSKV